MTVWGRGFAPSKSSLVLRRRCRSGRGKATCPHELALLFREFNFQRQWPGNAVGQVRQSNEHVEVDNLLVGKMFLEFRKVGVAGAVGSARKFLGIAKRDLLGRAKSRVVPLIQSLHLFRRQSGAFGGLDVVLRAVVASVDQ